MSGRRREVRLVYPHQLFAEHLDAPSGTRFVLVEDDLLFRQYRFHAHKLVLHRAALRRFANRLQDNGFDVEWVETDVGAPTGERLATLVDRLRPDRVTAYDVVDDWLGRDCVSALRDGGYRLTGDDVLESPSFLTSRADVRAQLTGRRARMQHFYSWQRTRLDVLLDDGQPVGGRWSFDTENRKKLPRNVTVPPVAPVPQHPEVVAAVEWVREQFPDAPGDPATFGWPTSHEEAEAAYETFLADRFALFGPYEDAISADHPFLFHSVVTPALNCGLLDPRHVLSRALEVGEQEAVPLPSLEGFVRQVIGWREYMRATYAVWGRSLRTQNRLGHHRPLAPGWWTGETGLDPVDLVIRRVLERGWAHHIERLMVLGNAMCLLRIDPDEVYQWFMELFVDAYDWVMVPNVYAMSQFAAGSTITTKPYVSGSNYLRKMSDLPAGDWTEDWDALYWTFVRDHHDLLDANPRSRMTTRLYDGLDPATKSAHTRRANRWLQD